MSANASIEALAEAVGIAVREGLQVGAISVLVPDPTYPALLLIDAPIAPSRLRRYPLDTEVQMIVEKNESLRTETLEIQALLAMASLPPYALAIALPRVAPEAVRHDLAGLRGVIAHLRDPESGCPWDLEQDHRTLRPHLLEETYEVLQALDRDDPHALREELGDLMMQVFLHAQIAEGDGQFDIDDVAEGIRAKLIRAPPARVRRCTSSGYQRGRRKLGPAQGSGARPRQRRDVRARRRATGPAGSGASAESGRSCRTTRL